MIVDTHTHVWHSPEQWGPQIGALLRQQFSAPTEQLDASGAAHSAAMAPVNVAFILGFRSRRLSADIPFSAINSQLANAPDRFIGFAGIDPLEDGYLEAIDGAVAEKYRGIVISPSEQGFHPLHSRAVRMYDKCQAMGLPIFVHQGGDYVRDSTLEYAQPFLFDAVARDFPQLKILLAHCGHPWTDQTLTLIGKHRNVFAELSGVAARSRQLLNVLLMAHQLDVTDRLLFGSDFPRQTPEHAVASIYSINQLAQGSTTMTVPREKLRSIIERDALAALGIRRAAPAARTAAPSPAVPMSADAVNQGAPS